MADLDPGVIHEVNDMAIALLTILVELDQTKKAASNPRFALSLQEMVDMAEDAFRDFVDQHRDVLTKLGGEPLATENAKVKFSLIETNTGGTNPDVGADGVHPREFVVVEPNDSFFAERDGEFIKPPTVTIELAPR